METGSNKSLFTLIAVVIFGIVLSLSYWLFQDEMQNVLATVMDKTGERTLVLLDTYKTIYESPEVTFNRTGSGAGPIISLKPLDYKLKEEYVLTFDLTLNSGQLVTIGGHLLGTVEDCKVYVNGVLKSTNHTLIYNTWYSGVPVKMDVNDTISVRVEFTQETPCWQYADNPIKIQPNRDWNTLNSGYNYDYNVSIRNIKIAQNF